MCLIPLVASRRTATRFGAALSREHEWACTAACSLPPVAAPHVLGDATVEIVEMK